jgi:hypothetical protein
MGRFSEIRGTTPKPGQLRDRIGMVRVLVRDQDGIKALRQRPAKGFEPPLNFLAAKTSVDEESSVLGFEQRRVARTS